MQQLLLSGKFQILEELAKGGMGTVYLAEQVGTDNFRKTVAIKIINPSLLRDKEALALFMGEAKLVADLLHENIVQVYHFSKSEDQYFMVMEMVFGKNLEKIIKRIKQSKTFISPLVAAAIMEQVCRGLDYAHRKRDREGRRLKVVHRDVSPANILLNYRGVAKLTDFGIAKALNLKVPDETEVLMGKFPYMSPEQVRFEGTDHRSDIFSLGLVFYELLTNEVVYPAESGDTLLEMMEYQKKVPPREINPQIPYSINEIILKAIERQPLDRFKSAREIRDPLNQYLLENKIIHSDEFLEAFMGELFPESRKNVYW
ncbi:MAG: serine/threonine-protein kinase [Planctomycetota bacterium]